MIKFRLVCGVVAAVVLAGCQSQPVPSPSGAPSALTPPPLPAVVKKSAVAVKTTTPVARPPVLFIYPADATNYVWSLVSSTNLQLAMTNWTIVASNMVGVPAGNFSAIATNPCMYYRMAGTPNALYSLKAPRIVLHGTKEN